MRAAMTGAVVLTAFLAACGSGVESDPTPSSSGVDRTGTSTSPSSKASTGKAVISGYGATRETWDASHRAAPGFAPGSAFLPLVGDRQPKYTAVSGGPGERILSYTLNFAKGTTLEQAKLEVLREFPVGAKFGVIDKDEARCVLMDIVSRSVEAEMEGYHPMVGFFSLPEADTAFDPRDVREAIFTVASSDETRDLGQC